MKPTIDIYAGSPLEIQSEKKFLAQLVSELGRRNESAFIFCNFYPPHKPHLQIDYLLITARYVLHIELKNLTAPIRATINGLWKLKLPDGTQKTYEGKNPYHQARDNKYAISDEMDRWGRSAQIAASGKYYTLFDSVICVFPELAQTSSIPANQGYVKVVGYPELLNGLSQRSLSPGWSWEQWKTFALELGLIRISDPSSAFGTSGTSSQILKAYSQRFADYYGRGIADLVPTPIRAEGKVVKADTLSGIHRDRRHLQLVGISGQGKTHLAKHIALAACAEGTLPIMAFARNFQGDFQAFLDNSVAHLNAGPAGDILAACKKETYPAVAVIDGFNECPKPRQQELLQNLQAFYLKWGIPIIFTTQESLSLPAPLMGESLQFLELKRDDKLGIAAFYCKQPLADEVQETILSFNTPYEISIACECVNELQGVRTRGQLLDIFVESHCRRLPHGFAVRRILGLIAEEMRRELSASILATEAWRVAERFIAKENLPGAVIEEVSCSPLLQFSRGQLAFRHELIQAFLAADHFVRSHPEADGFARDLATADTRDLAEFAISLQGDARVLRLGLEQLEDARALTKCAAGLWGEVAKKVVRDDIRSTLKAALKFAQREQIAAKRTNDGVPGILLTDARGWSKYERNLMCSVGATLKAGQFLTEVFRLTKAFDAACGISLGNMAGDSRSSLGSRSELFAAAYVFGWELPASLIVRTAEQSGQFNRKLESKACEELARLSAQPKELSPGQLFLACIFFTGQEEVPRHLVALFCNAYATGIYHLQLHAFHMLQSYASKLSAPLVDEVKDVLSQLQSKNAFIASEITETLMVYGMVESPITSEGARQEIQDILRGPDDDARRQMAYGAVSNIFEDVFQGAYYEAITELSADERLRLLVMASLGAPSYGFSDDWILQELLRCDDKRALPGFLKWATQIECDSVFTQGTAGCFLLAHMGCARYMEAPPRLTSIETDDQRAWQLYGEMFFWLHKPNLSDSEIIAKCRPIWEQLTTIYPNASVDPLRHFDSWSRAGLDRSPIEAMRKLFEERIRGILELGLDNRHKLSTIFQRQSDFARKECAKFALSMLSAIGDVGSIAVIRPLVGDPELGSAAVEAIREINSGNH